MSPLACEQDRALRALHGRWPHRRFHCRYDLHALRELRRRDCLGRAGRVRARGALRTRRRPGSH